LKYPTGDFFAANEKEKLEFLLRPSQQSSCGQTRLGTVKFADDTNSFGESVSGVVDRSVVDSCLNVLASARMEENVDKRIEGQLDQ
ncbi:unnamed protein product, partial [Amoebophrya sp. A120]